MDRSLGDTRVRMARTFDSRAQRTRAKLIDSFAELANGGEPVTAARVVQHAGVNRTTFYAHFASVDALAVESITELFEIVGAVDAANRGRGRDGETSETSLLDVAQFLADRRAVYGPLLQAGTFYRAVEDAFTRRNVSTFTSIPGLSEDVDVDLLARFVAAGVLGVLVRWLADDASAPAAEVAQNLRQALPPSLTA